MSSRELQRAIRRNADRNSERIKGAGTGGAFYATVASVTGGAASDNLAVVTVNVRGDETTASAYNTSYTPAVGQRVLCLYVGDQLNIVCAVGGAP